MNETNPSVWLILPIGTQYGWGVCGRYLSLEMSKLMPVKLLTEDFAGTDNAYRSFEKELSHLHVSLDQLDTPPDHHGTYHFSDAVLQTIAGSNMQPWFVNICAPKVIGYTFIEKTALKKDDVLWANEYFNWIVAGSSWCERVLKQNGVTNSSTIIQGINDSLFHSGYAEKQQNKDVFVVFSGGKLELRKGQDLVIRAFKVLQDRYDDVLLVNCWYNKWDDSLMTLKHSPYILFDMPKGDYVKAVNRLIHTNGISPQKVVTLPPQSHKQMAEIYRNTDCGLFPNRCEGGTNLVLMEYMACGKPAIASYATGHKDILTETNCIPIQSMGKFTLQNNNGTLVEQWDNPNLDEIIAHLEWAYQNRDTLKVIGDKAATSMQAHTWRKTAKKFMNILMDPNDA